MRRAIVVVAALLAACGDNQHPDVWPFFDWDAQRVIGSISLDHLAPTELQPIIDEMDMAKATGTVLMLYAHVPGTTVQRETLDAILSAADERGMATLTYHELADGGPPRRGVSISFDDTAIDEWYSLRDMLARHEAHVSFFVTRYAEWTDAQREKLHTLYNDGDSIEAHGVKHRNGVDYVRQAGMKAYVADEVLPSIQILRDDGFDPVAFAFPYGAHTRAMEDALAPMVPIVRGISETPGVHH